jgi:hypothetical protein
VRGREEFARERGRESERERGREGEGEREFARARERERARGEGKGAEGEEGRGAEAHRAMMERLEPRDAASTTARARSARMRASSVHTVARVVSIAACH